MLQGVMTDAYDDDNPAPPAGVTLRDPEDSDSIRGDIEGGISNAMQRYVHGFEYGGVRLELSDVKYADKERYSLAEQKEALMSDRLLSRRLRGTVKLIDVETNKPLDVKKNFTLARVPYLTQRGTFINNGSEMAPAMQSRLLPGAYTRRRDNGALECLHYTSRIWTEVGMLQIGKIVSERMQIRVWSYDFGRKEFVLRPILNWFKNPVRVGIGRARFDSNGRCPSATQVGKDVLWATGEHYAMTLGGGKRCLSDDREPLLMVEDAPNSTQEQVILGSVMGDGYLSAGGDMQEAHCVEQRDYLEWKSACLSPMLKRGVVVKPVTSKGSFGAAKEIVWLGTKSYAFLRRLREEFYPGGVKVVPQSVLDRMGPLAIAVWFCDDGCGYLAENQRGATSCSVISMATLGFGKDDLDRIVKWFADRWGIQARLRRHKDARSPNNAERFYVNFYGEHADKFCDLVAPYIPESMRYKLPSRPPTSACACGVEQSAGRKRCNACWINWFNGHEKTPSDTHGIRKRFGGMSSVRAVCASGIVPADLNPGEAWDIRSAIVGSAVDQVAADNKLRLVVTEVPYSFDAAEGTTFNKASWAYDLEVEETHNYVANGVVVSNCHLNVRPGSGSAMRVTLDPQTAQYRIKIGTSDLHAYSLFKELGVSDEELERRWGKQVMEINRSKYSKDTLGRAYMKAIPKWERDPSLDPAAKAAAVRAAFDRAQVAESILRTNLPNLYNREKSAFWRSAGRAIDAADGMIKSSTISFSPDLSPAKVFDTWQEFDFELNDAIKEASFDPDLKPGDMKETYNSIYGKKGPRLASMRAWPEHWLDDQDKQGWLQWYENYVDGRRSDQDAKQIERWKSFKRRHGAQFISNPTPRRAYALTNWAIDPLELLPEEKREEFKGTMEAYRNKEYMKWYMNRHDFDDDAAERLGKLALGRGAELKSDKPGPGELMALALAGHIKPEDLS